LPPAPRKRKGRGIFYLKLDEGGIERENGRASGGGKMKPSKQQSQRFNYKLIMIGTAVCGASFPFTTWLALGLVKADPNSLVFGLTLRTNIIVGAILSVLALLTSFAMFKRNILASIPGIAFGAIMAGHFIVGTIRIYDRIKYIPSLKWNMMLMAAMGFFAFIFLARYFIFDYPRFIKTPLQSLDQEKGEVEK
jgi:hypothetical protein